MKRGCTLSDIIDLDVKANYRTSAGKKKSVHISRAGIYIKPLLVQCANALIKDKDFPHFRYHYEAIKRRRGHKRAIIAVARMMLTAIYHILKNNTTFDFQLYENTQRKPDNQSTKFKQAVILLQRLGYTIMKEIDSA